LFDPFAASSRRYPANTATKKAETAKQRQNRSTSRSAHRLADTRTVSRRFDTGWTHSGSQPVKSASPNIDNGELAIDNN
jgi:hypothetical protein